jgi:hypothetical protein
VYKENPYTPIYTLSSWHRTPDETLFDYFRSKEAPFPRRPRLTTYVFFDDAQETYEDNDLWNTFLKDVEATNFRVVLFCNYGSPTNQVVTHPKGTPTRLRHAARVSLRPSDDGAPGLLLSPEEYEDVICHYHEASIEFELRDLIFGWTAGHVGAVTDILHAISNKARSFRFAACLTYFNLVANFTAPHNSKEGHTPERSTLL